MKKEAETIQKMFARIAWRYDFLNHFLSLSFDRSWRKKAVREVRLPEGGLVLDVCCGTGDMAIALHKTVRTELASPPRVQVVGVDFCYEMLRLALEKVRKAQLPILFLQGDALQLPFPDSTFDTAMVAFGIRNVVDRKTGLIEMLRVIKPEGRLIVLEFYKPSLPLFSAFYLIYFRYVLPFLGRILSRDTRAYSYLPASVLEFYTPEEFGNLMIQAGCQEVQFKRLTGGIVAVHIGVKPGQ
jgi:demethylmenaquinone methyltransferase/2-methoxy-6-polyprenyl-1,4-benzoquinol methylase